MGKIKGQLIIINEDHQQQRIDNFLYGLFNKKIARNFIHQIIRTGQVRVNSGRIKSNYNLKLNDQLRVPPIKLLPELNKEKPEANKVNNNKDKILQYWSKQLEKAIIYEDQNLIIINKPVKLAVHGGSKLTTGLIEILRHMRPLAPFLELVHRIDQYTSGCLMIAKKRSYLRQLHLLLQQQKITKLYLAIVVGDFKYSKKIIEQPLKKIITKSKEHIVKPAIDGNYAKTEFKLVEKLKINNKKYSLITAKPITGKTHQIRAHLAYLGYPIVNDDKYGNKVNKSYNELSKDYGITRMMLHAKYLKFVCPKTNKIIEITADYDAEFKKII